MAGRGEVYNEKGKGCSMPVQQSTGSKGPQRGPARCPSWHGDTDHTRPKQAALGPVVLWHWPRSKSKNQRVVWICDTSVSCSITLLRERICHVLPAVSIGSEGWE